MALMSVGLNFSFANLSETDDGAKSSDRNTTAATTAAAAAFGFSTMTCCFTTSIRSLDYGRWSSCFADDAAKPQR